MQLWKCSVPLKSWVRNEKLMINSQSLSEIQIAELLYVDAKVQMLWNILRVLWSKSRDPKSAINFSMVSKPAMYEKFWPYILHYLISQLKVSCNESDWLLKRQHPVVWQITSSSGKSGKRGVVRFVSNAVYHKRLWYPCWKNRKKIYFR